MLGRPNRLSSRRDIGRVYRHGKRANTRHLELKTAPNQLDLNRLTIVVSTKVAKKAVTRNRARRRLRGLAREYWQSLPAGHDLLFTVRADTGQLDTATLRQELETCLLKAGLWHPTAP